MGKTQRMKLCLSSSWNTCLVLFCSSLLTLPSPADATNPEHESSKQTDLPSPPLESDLTHENNEHTKTGLTSPTNLDGSEPETNEKSLNSTAQLFFQAIMGGMPQAILELVDYPFNLDGEIIDDKQNLSMKLTEALRATDFSNTSFYGVRLYSPTQMIKEFGNPPKRLGDIDLSNKSIAVANFGGHAHIAILQRAEDTWRVVAYTE